jgi:tetratricopeptide (TPR) repeat protein
LLAEIGIKTKGRLAALCFLEFALGRPFKHLVTIAALVGMLALCVTAYWPGLRGGFLFDDFGNLNALGALGPVRDWASFCRYITSGHADPTGRPLALLTFLIDAQDWPAAPWPFKRTNLLLHLLNGGLLWSLLSTLGHLARTGTEKRHARKAALAGAAFWLLHPLFVSTTLYVVQREAMLSTTCVMLGLLIWLHGRGILLQGFHVARGITWCLAGLIGCTVLGTLAKANGALLPLMIVVIETCFPATSSSGSWKALQIYRRFFLFAAGVPSALLVGYLVWSGIHGIIIGGVVSGRSWTLAQRLLSEPRVLLDYLGLLWLPRPLSSGLFNDQYVVSTSLLHPLSTLFALVALAAMAVTAWAMRHRKPVIAVAILFFFAGQLLESSSIPLELYYEHRSYLPALLMFWPLGWWLTDHRNLTGLKLCMLVLLPLGLASLTYLRAIEWGQPDAQALLWARINPQSPRAQAYAASFEIDQGHYVPAILRLTAALSNHPNEPQLTFTLINAYCGTGSVPVHAVAEAVSAMRSTVQRGSLYANWLEHGLSLARDGKCRSLNLNDIGRMADAGSSNPALQTPGIQQDFTYIRAQVYLAQGKAELAQEEFQRALDIQVRPALALSAAATLGSEGYPKLGLDMLDYYESIADRAQIPDPGMPHIHAWVLASQHYWPKEIAHLRSQLIADAMTRHASPDSQPSPR